MTGVNEGASEQLPAIELANLRFLSILGQGGMGTVYLAEQRNPKRKVAVKIVAPNDDIPRAFLDALKNEGDIAACFEHDNLAHVYECGIVDDHYYLVMQYLGGGSLEDRLRQSTLSVEEAVAIFSDVASALGEIHEQGYVHRDIKPGNILFTAAGKPVLADFGIAKHAESVGALTSAGYSIGTPTYMSPEQIRNDTLDGRSDLYSLGVVMHEAMSGQPPFTEASEHELKEAHLRARAPRLTAGQALQPVVDRLLAKGPDDRYADTGQLIDALAAIDTSSDPGTPTVSVQATTPTRAPSTHWSKGLFRELRQRKVLQTAAVYGVAAYTVTEIATFLFENFSVPLWANRLLAALFVAGFPVAMLLSYVFDFEAGGIKRTRYRGRSTKTIITAAMVLLLVGTGGLFYLIFPEELADQPVPQTAQMAPTAAPISNVAVLPFANMSGNAEDEYFGDGLADTILNQLHKIQGISLIARTSSFSYKGKNVDVRQIGAELNAGAVLEGSVQRGGGQLRIIAQLIETEGGTHLWSETYDRPAQDLFAVQDEIALAVSKALNLEIRASIRAESERPPSGNLAAYDAYIQGRELRRGLDLASVSRSIAFFEQATDADPDYAAAWASLAEARMMEAFLSSVPVADFANDPIKTSSYRYAFPNLFADVVQAALEPVETALQKAQVLAPNSPQVILAAAQISARKFDFDQPLQTLPRYLDRDAGHPEILHLYALALRHAHRYEESTAILAQAMELDPRSPEMMSDYAAALSFAGELEKAVELYETLLRDFPALEEIVGKEYAGTLAMNGKHGRALAVLSRPGLDQTDPLILYWRAKAAHYLGFQMPDRLLEAADLTRHMDLPAVFLLLPNLAVEWLIRDEADKLASSAAFARKWAETTNIPFGHVFAARCEIALGNFEGALADLARADQSFPPWAEWQLSTGQLINGLPHMDGLTYALALERSGEARRARATLASVLDRIRLMEQGGSRENLLAAVKAKALYLNGQKDEALQALEEGYERNLVLPSGLDLEWRAIFGDDPAIRAFEEHMALRRAELRAEIPEPDLSPLTTHVLSIGQQ